MGAKTGLKISCSFQKINNAVLLRAEFGAQNSYLDLSGDNSKFINNQIMFWSTKKGNKLITTIGGLDPKEEIDSNFSHDTENIRFISIRSAYLLRMGFTTNSYAIGGDDFKAMVSAEKKLGTLSGLD